MRVASLALALVLLASGAATAAWPVPGAPCPGPFDEFVGSGWIGSRPYLSLGCDGEPIKVCAPTWVGTIDLLFIC